mmetsp:Transcript_25260/g.63364  ORF Transcript_25260/g.63364 Transcript_25260/m.63364 type:complete len:207 (+) Transcript_25260:825-1445(+)
MCEERVEGRTWLKLMTSSSISSTSESSCRTTFFIDDARLCRRSALRASSSAAPFRRESGEAHALKKSSRSRDSASTLILTRFIAFLTEVRALPTWRSMLALSPFFEWVLPLPLWVPAAVVGRWWALAGDFSCGEKSSSELSIPLLDVRSARDICTTLSGLIFWLCISSSASAFSRDGEEKGGGHEYLVTREGSTPLRNRTRDERSG